MQAETTAKSVVRNGKAMVVVLVQQQKPTRDLSGIVQRYTAWLEDTGEILFQNVRLSTMEHLTDAWLEGYARGYDARAAEEISGTK